MTSRTIALLSFSLIFLPVPAMADMPLLYAQPRDAVEQSVMAALPAAADPAAVRSIAKADLNGDGVDEWIVRETTAGCEAAAACAFTVAGLTAGRPVLLGTIAAGKVAVADEKLYGVRKLLAYNDKNDDFRAEPYVWSPHDASFVMQSTLLR